ncbi:MAG: hypothetical protein LBR10_00345 [Prevotellaceae bacterium]|jgi:hypothetical protein|nr:hypothetical protein [Prevotellaceae bacterium]
MINTVFVIGAGASHEIDMPLGSVLKKQIAQLFKRDSAEISISAHQNPKKNVYQSLELYQTGTIQRTSQRLIVGDNTPEWVKNLILAESIDNFINNHRDKEDLVVTCKVGIIQAILQTEEKSKLFDNRPKSNFYKLPMYFKDIEDTYYVALWKKLIEGCLYHELVERLKQITFIVFNYDRSLEYFLYNAIKEYYEIDDKESAKAVNGINIIHPYGQVGFLDCLHEDGIHYGSLSTPEKICGLVHEIKTFTETVNPDNETYKKMYKSISAAERLIFLGFAYHAQNLQLLFPEGLYDENSQFRKNKYPTRRSALEIYGTCFGLSDVDQQYVKGKLNGITENVAIRGFFDGECRKFFSEYNLALSFL